MVTIEPRIPTVPCPLQGGHEWSPPLTGEDALGNPILLRTCIHCGKVVSGNEPAQLTL